MASGWQSWWWGKYALSKAIREDGCLSLGTNFWLGQEKTIFTRWQVHISIVFARIFISAIPIWIFAVQLTEKIAQQCSWRFNTMLHAHIKFLEYFLNIVFSSFSIASRLTITCITKCWYVLVEYMIESTFISLHTSSSSNCWHVRWVRLVEKRHKSKWISYYKHSCHYLLPTFASTFHFHFL